jgi:alginate O-acetyltransferase complex protein AlgI
MHMVFSSPIFLFLFLPVVLTVYFFLPGLRWRNAWLLLASFIFYAWGEVAFIFLLLISTLLNWQFGLWIERCENPRERKMAVALAVTMNVGFLAFFKYAGFFVATLNKFFLLVGISAWPQPHIALPIGISFFTFHALSYIVDIYRRKWPAARNPCDTALYIFFFPQLIAGPILRWSGIAPQLIHRHYNRATFAEGIRRFVGGLAKKMIIANAVAVPADQIFSLPANQLSAPLAWLGVACYTLQIYFDFSGYSDMAVGLGKMFGFTFIENFNFPYISQSIREFWRRWHISLSTWFRDYVYIPLGGNRVSAARTHFNLILVFFLCGLWHGASWTFVIWGLYHGIFLVLERTSWGNALEKLPRPLRHLYAIFIVMMGWVLFRADTFSSATNFFAALFGFNHVAQTQPLGRFATNEVIFALVAGTLFSLPLWNFLKNSGARAVEFFPAKIHGALFCFGQILEIVLVVAALLISSAWLAGGTYNPFIYFRF